MSTAEYALSVPLIITLHSVVINDRLMEVVKTHPTISPQMKMKLQILVEALNVSETHIPHKFPTKDPEVISHYVAMLVTAIYQNNTFLKEFAQSFLESMLDDETTNEQRKLEIANISKTIHDTIDLIFKLGKPPPKISAVVDTIKNGELTSEVIRITYFANQHP